MKKKKKKAKLKKLVCRRKTIRAQVSRCNNRCSAYNTFSDSDRATESALLLDYKEDLSKFDELIQNLKYNDSVTFDEKELQVEMDTCDEYRCKILECLAILDSISSSRISSNTSLRNNNLTDAARSLLKQPTAPLPKFSGEEGEDLLKFLREFTLTTSSYSYPDRDLLLLLIQQTSGKAKTLLNSLELDNQSFQEAKDLLTVAFASPEIRKFSSIKKLNELHLGFNDDPFEYIAKVKMLIESVKSLNICSDDFLQYYVWTGLNERFQNHLIQITTKTKPSIKEIVDNFFIANERYALSVKSRLAKKSVFKENTATNLAINVKTKSKFLDCTLCSKDGGSPVNHSISRCTEYKTATSKIDRLKKLGGCLKCSSLTHKADNCKFKFKRKCRNCSKWHFDFLCSHNLNGNQNEGKKKETADSTATNSGVVVLQSFSCDSVLPTFSFSINKNGKLLRGLSDRGSQSSFITESVASNQNLRCLQENVKLTIKGFNELKHYVSRLVEVPIHSGNLTFKIPCLVVPKIDINLKLPGLGKVVKNLKEKGYYLADEFLTETSDNISSVDFVLGSDHSRFLAGQDVCFGKLSMYIDTHIGIMLLGNVNNLNKDLSSLSYFNPITTELCTNEIEMQNVGNVGSSDYEAHTFFISHFDNFVSDEIQNLDFSPVHTNANLTVLNKGKVVEDKLQIATDEILEAECNKYINLDSNHYNDESNELHESLIDYTLRNISRSEDGRIVVPLLWNGKVAPFLSKNQRLSKIILKSNFKKLQKNGNLELVDQTFRDQLDAGIIERIENLDQFLEEHPEHSFLPHMSIVKLDRDTTKCRVVFLSNLCELDRVNKKLGISHNQALHAGPSLNYKLASALLQLRFGSHLLIYDLKKAFNQLVLNPRDQHKLLFFWYRNIKKGDYSLVAYKNVRLSFGLRCSPFLLMISLYYILVLESEHDHPDLKNLKHSMYNLFYMDNGALSADSNLELENAYEKLKSIFSPYKFSVQQICTNDLKLQDMISEETGEQPTDCVKLLGLMWDRHRDVIYTKPICLDRGANTKRSILKSIASHFDLYNFNMPILNRSRLFMHSLQCNKEIAWDDKLSPKLLQEWRCICKQANSSPVLEIPRFVGPRNGSYRLYAFTDASHTLFYSDLLNI